MEGNQVVSCSGVLGEAVDYSSERIGVEEEHWGVSPSLEHGAVKGVTEVDEDSSDERSGEARYAKSSEGEDDECCCSIRVLLMRKRRRGPGSQEQTDVSHQNERCC